MRLAIFLCIGLFFLAHQPAWAGEVRKDQECPIVARLAIYLESVSSYTRKDICPPLIFSSNAPEARGPMLDRAAERNIGATFYPESGAIQISVIHRPDSVEGQAQILHELVHFYQFAEGREKGLPCLALLEAEAFALQARYLADNGYETEAEAARNEGFLRARCSQEYHP